MPRNKKLGGERWSWAVMSPLPESELSKATILDFFSWALPLRSPEQNYRSLPLDPKPIVVRTGQDKFVDNVKKLVRVSRPCLVFLVLPSRGGAEYGQMKNELKEGEPQTAFQGILASSVESKFGFATAPEAKGRWKGRLNGLANDLGRKVPERVPSALRHPSRSKKAPVGGSSCPVANVRNLTNGMASVSIKDKRPPELKCKELKGEELKGEEWNWAIVSPLDPAQLSEHQIRAFFEWVVPNLAYSRNPAQKPVHLPLVTKPIAVHTGVPHVRVARTIQELLRAKENSKLCLVVLVMPTTHDSEQSGAYNHYETLSQLAVEEPETAFQSLYYENITTQFQYAKDNPKLPALKQTSAGQRVLNAVSHLGSSIGSKVTQRVPMEKRLLKSAVAQKKEEELLAD